jgi:prepilin-type N-terminal cleavage/methylation domain-containing protein
MRAFRRGFTLVELMVVILIIALLAGVLGVAVVSVFGSGKKTEAESTIRMLSSAITSFETLNKTLPASSISALSMQYDPASAAMDFNATNKGIEALLYSLRAKGLSSGRLLSDEDFDRLRCNTDDEGGAELLAVDFLNAAGTPLLWEVRDPWGNPYVYVNFEDETGMVGLDPILSVMRDDKTIVEVDLQVLKDSLMDPVTGSSRAKRYALWSFGADGENNYGRGDDIVSWVKFD